MVNEALEESILVFDLYVVNTTLYVPHRAKRNGKRAGEGDFGVVNLADSQSCNFDFIFVNSQSGAPYTVTQEFPFYFFDFDKGEASYLVRSSLPYERWEVTRPLAAQREPWRAYLPLPSHCGNGAGRRPPTARADVHRCVTKSCPHIDARQSGQPTRHSLTPPTAGIGILSQPSLCEPPGGVSSHMQRYEGGDLARSVGY